MTDVLLAGLALGLAAAPALLFLANLWVYRRAPHATEPPGLSRRSGRRGQAPPLVEEAIYVLIPARNEESAIAAAVEAALASRDVTLEVVVLDDHSDDHTAAVVAELSRRDPRVRLEKAPPLPPGWCGKQHACHVLSTHARHPLLAFLDADVRVAPYGLARLAAFLRASGADLISGVPHQQTGSLAERLLIPLIHFVLLGFLPMARMRRSTHPSYAAGCGQLFLVRRDAYEAVGGHAGIRSTLHDGIRLPRLFRASGRRTDLCDATDLASCRMYRGAAETWRGLAKNATEGLAAPRVIVPMTVVLLGGQVLPFALLAGAAWLSPTAVTLAALAVLLAYTPRLLGVARFRQPLVGAILHPVGVALLVAIQWYAFCQRVVGAPTSWRGRTYQPESA
ncbi:MAG: glycosyltransferase family 2 protein [Gemmataceae bacterium]